MRARVLSGQLDHGRRPAVSCEDLSNLVSLTRFPADHDSFCGLVMGADRHERSGDRLNYRNGYRDPTLDTPPGPLSLRIAKLRQGWVFPLFLEPRNTADKAFVISRVTIV
jgi:transposase-like protein